MLKNIVSPIQAWLLSQGRCVGCGKFLSEMNHSKFKGDEEKVTCACRRVYIYNKKTKKYRRALLNEA
ncbi:MAG: hypothetical protein HY044_01615 [Candidatus Woesebacteria bacterium]|nr:MAG: hypothetical protein HY044_01615 [Candidatus Woesebacteria bacterium]